MRRAGRSRRWRCSWRCWPAAAGRRDVRERDRRGHARPTAATRAADVAAPRRRRCGSPSSRTARRRASSGRSSATASTPPRARSTSLVDYRAPDVYSLRAHERPDRPGRRDPARTGSSSRSPSPALAPAIRRAVKAGIPVVSINSGSDVFRRLGVLAHVGQPEERAGLRGRASGWPPPACGSVLCVNQQIGNTGARRTLPRAGARDARGRRPLAGARRRRPEPGDAAQDRRRRAQPDASTASSPSTPPAGIEAVKGARAARRHARSEDRDLRSRPRRAARRPRRPDCSSRSTSRPTCRATCRS